MSDLRFKCYMCGKCCHEVKGTKDDPTYKRIPLYPDEVKRLEILSNELGIKMNIIEDVVFPDIKNKKILVLTYRIMLDNEEKVCPFHSKSKGCLIQDQKPQACLAYPLAVQQIDAFNVRIEIDPLCKFTIENYNKLAVIDYNNLQKIYPNEWKHAKNMLMKNKNAIMKIRRLEYEKRIEIPKSVDLEDFNMQLKNWERFIIDNIGDED